VHNASFSFDFGPDELVKMVGIAADEGSLLVQELFKNTKFKLQDNKIIVTDLQELVKQVGFYKKMDVLDRKRQKIGDKS
jgi:hypothetical protein